MLRFVNTKGGKPTSCDPLNADSSENFHVALMMYLTPIEISVSDELRSTLLSHFNYNFESRTMTWKARVGLTYSDGTEITPKDIAFSVSRMAFTRPMFPILRDITGLKEWLRSENPLATFPAGIKVLNQEILITFERPVGNPLSRFVLPIFSVIPERCVGSNSNKLSVEIPPSSGYFQLKKQEQDGHSWIFERRGEYEILENKKLPDIVTLEYWSSEKVMKNMPMSDENTVIRTHENAYSPKELKKMRECTEQGTRKGSSFGCFNINPHVEPFQDENCRKVFANLYRLEYERLYQSIIPLESSLFTKNISGYVKQSQFQKHEVNNYAECVDLIRKNPPLHAVLKGHSDSTLFNSTMLKVYERLGLSDIKPVEVTDRKEIAELFLNGKTTLFVSSSQFWELDVVGEIKMFFTPNMHPPLKFVTENLRLQELVSKLDVEGNIYDNQTTLEELNRLVFDQALLNVYSHFQMLLLSKKGHPLEAEKHSATITKPWDVF